MFFIVGSVRQYCWLGGSRELQGSAGKVTYMGFGHALFKSTVILQCMGKATESLAVNFVLFDASSHGHLSVTTGHSSDVGLVGGITATYLTHSEELNNNSAKKVKI